MSFVYVIAARREGPCKIGHGKRPEGRLTHLQIGSHERLTLFSKWDCGDIAAEVERVAHAALDSCRLSGEWFSCSVAEAENTIINSVDWGCDPEHKQRMCDLRLKYGGDMAIDEIVKDLGWVALNRHEWEEQERHDYLW